MNTYLYGSLDPMTFIVQAESDAEAWGRLQRMAGDAAWKTPPQFMRVVPTPNHTSEVKIPSIEPIADHIVPFVNEAATIPLTPDMWRAVMPLLRFIAGSINERDAEITDLKERLQRAHSEMKAVSLDDLLRFMQSQAGAATGHGRRV